MSHRSTKRQSKLEIRAHRRLLPRKVASPDEQKFLTRQHNQLQLWLSQPENEAERFTLLKMLEKHEKASALSQKFYTEGRRRRFVHISEVLRYKENQFIQFAMKRKQQEDEDNETISENQREENASVISSLIIGFKELFCCGNFY